MVWLKEEGRYAGFHNATPTLAEVRAKAAGKTFLNFDDATYGEGIQTYLAEQFPQPSKYETGQARA